MKRDIKFRALFRHLSTRKEVWFEIIPNYTLKDIGGYVQISDWKQYTGLKDKNGVEIYEGDILGHISSREAGYPMDGLPVHRVVQFGKTNPRNNVLTNYIGFWGYSPNNLEDDCPTSIQYLVSCHNSEIVGNIHQDKHLLTQPTKK